MFASTRRRLFNNGGAISRRFFSSENRKTNSKLFDDRTLGLVTLLVSIPTAAYIWKHHKSSKAAAEHHSILKEESKPVKMSVPLVKKRKVKYLIVGGGAAGFSAIQAIKEADPEAQIVLVSKEPVEPYLRPPLSKELWFSDVNVSDSIEQFSFSDWHGNKKPVVFENKQFYQDAGVEMILGCEAVDFDLEKRQIGLSDGQVLEFDRLLIATGANPKVLDAPIDESVRPLVKSFRSIADFVELYKALKEQRDMKIVVIGGGFLGSELSVAAAKIAGDMGHSVTQVFPEYGHMALVFPKYLSQWTSEKMSKLGVHVRAKRSVRSIERNESGSPVKLVLDNGEELEADRVIVAVGVEPALSGSFKSSLKVDKEFGGLEADKFLQVAPGVFSAGDVVSYVDPILGCRRRTEHFDHAVLSGKQAGINMVRSLKDGDLEPYSNESMFWSDLGPEVGYEAVGLVDSSLTTVGVWARARPTESPQGTELDATDIRVQSIGQTSISSTEPKTSSEEEPVADGSQSPEPVSTGPAEIEHNISEKLPEIKTTTSAEMSPTYGKGVVFYLKDRKIVGILLFNLFNRVGLAKQILKEGKGVDDVSSCVRLFNVEEVA